MGMHVVARADPHAARDEVREAHPDWIAVGEDGQPRRLRILRGLGLGLDEKAIEAVSRWKFKPAQRNGHPVRAAATIEVNFRLL